MTADDIYALMLVVQARLEAFLKREEPLTRAELAKFIEAVKAQPAPVQDPVELAQLLMPELIAQLPKQLPMKVDAKTEEIVKLLSPVINRQVSAIEATNERLLRVLPQHLVALDAMLAARLQALQAREVSTRAVIDKMPSKVEVDFVRSWQKLGMVAFGPMLGMLAILAMCGAFSKEPVATYNSMVKAYYNIKAYNATLNRERDSLRQVQATQGKELNFYRDKVRQYRKKFPKSAPGLPLYSPVKK